MGFRPLLGLLSCALTLLCPVFCLADAGPRAPGSPAGCTGHDHHEHSSQSGPHHQHTPAGEPVPVSTHGCFCTTGAPTSASVQVPALEPSAAILSQALRLEGLVPGAAFALLEATVALGCPAPEGIPLLI